MNQVTISGDNSKTIWIIRDPSPAVRALEAREAEFAAEGGFCYIYNEEDHVEVRAKTGAARAFKRALDSILERERPVPASARQIEYALDLLARHDEPHMGGGIVKPTADQVRQMDRTSISRLIDTLRRDVYQGIS